MAAGVSTEAASIRIDGLTLAAKVWGPSTGIPTLALHGWLDNAASFDTLAPLLPDMRVVALDLPGHGESEHHPDGVLYGFVDLVAEVVQALDTLGWERCALLGHSLGGGLASILAGTVPQRVSHLVLIEALGPLIEEPAGAPKRLADSMRDQSARRGRPPPVHVDADAAAQRLATSRGLGLSSARTLVGRGLRRVEGGVTWSTDPKLRIPSRHRLSEAHVEAFLRRVEAPTLLVQATRGLPVIEEAIKQRAGHVRDIQVERLQGGHHLHLDDPQPVAALIRQFIAGRTEGHE